VTSALTVAATDSSDTRGGFSDKGSCVDLFAPGVEVPTAGINSDTSYVTVSSSTLAAAHAAGAAALLMASIDERPELNATEAVVNTILDSAFKDVVRDVAGTPNRLLAITWGALRMIVIGPSEPGSEADGSRRKKCVKAPADIHTCAVNSGDFGQRLGMDRFKDTFAITVEGDKVCGERYDNDEDDFLPNSKFSAAALDDGGWTINLKVLCNFHTANKKDSWVFLPVGDQGASNLCAANFSSDRKNIYYVQYDDVGSLKQCEQLCKDRHGCKGYGLKEDKKCEVWLKEIHHWLRFPASMDKQSDDLGCRRYIGRGSAGMGMIRLAQSPEQCLEVGETLSIQPCKSYDNKQVFTWAGVGPFSLNRTFEPAHLSGESLAAQPSTVCMVAQNHIDGVQHHSVWNVGLSSCTADSSQVFAFEGSGTISWVGGAEELCLAVKAGSLTLAPCDKSDPAMQFIHS